MTVQSRGIIKGLIPAIAIMVIILFTFPASATEKDKELYKMPEFSLEGVKPSQLRYSALTKDYITGWKPISDPSEAKGRPVLKVEDYFFDRNKDGKTDLFIQKMFIPAWKSKTPGGLELMEKKGIAIIVQVDDNFDDIPDRILVDSKDKKGNNFPDGTADLAFDLHK